MEYVVDEFDDAYRVYEVGEDKIPRELAACVRLDQARQICGALELCCTLAQHKDDENVGVDLLDHLTVEAIERVINKAIYIHNNECNSADAPIDHGPWSIQLEHHKRHDMQKALLALQQDPT